MTSSMTQDHNLEKQIEKQMGCMSGFFQLFDRHQILSGKKFHSTKRLTSPSVAGASDTASSDVPKQLAKPETPSPERQKPSPSPASPILRQPFFIFDSNERSKSSLKFKETSRLSMDSRATYDAKGNIRMKEIRADRLMLQCNSTEDEEKQPSRSSTSVIARLMGLEPISQAEQVKPAELRRCTSDSRFTRDLFQHRFIDGDDISFPVDESKRTVNFNPIDRVVTNGKSEMGGELKSLNKGMVTSSPPSWKLPLHRKSFFETEEAFPEAPQKQSVSVYGEVEKRLKMRGIDEVTKDLDTLKQILEVWQLKGLLHSKSNEEEQNINYRNVVYDRNFAFEDSPVHVNESMNYRSDRGARRNVSIRGGNAQLVSPRRGSNVRSPTRTRGSNSPTGNERNVKRSNTIVKSKSLTVETDKRVNGSTMIRRSSSTMNSSSPTWSPRRTGSSQVVSNRSPRSSKKAIGEKYLKERIIAVEVAEDESSSVSESSLSTTPAQNVAAEGLKVMEWKEGRNLLERCDKLLHSIGELNVTEQQSSPVSVLDSSFYDSAASPSPIMKRTIHFKDNSDELLQQEEGGNDLILLNQAELEDASEDCDLVYISEILRTCNYFPRDCDIFTFLEKQQCLKGKDTSDKVSRLQRKLVFDTINEMLERHRQLPPWKAFSQPPIEKIWSEFKRIRAEDNRDNNDLVEMVCGVVTKDLAGDGWEEYPVELSAVILDIERMIFRDAITDSIGDLAILVAPCRRLVF